MSRSVGIRALALLRIASVDPKSVTRALEGTAESFLDGKTNAGGSNSSLYCPSSMKHGIRNVGEPELKH